MDMPTHPLNRKVPSDAFNGTNQSGKHRCQQRPGHDAKKKVGQVTGCQDRMIWASLWKDLRTAGQCSCTSHSFWHPARVSDVHFASALWRACPLTSSSSWERWLQRGFPSSFLMRQSWQDPALYSFESNNWVQARGVVPGWPVLYFGSGNAVFTSGPYLHSTMFPRK